MQRLLALCETIENPAIKEKVIEFLGTKIPPYFKTIPASSSGKYHPNYCLGEGGCLRHTIAAVKLLNHMLSLAMMQKSCTPLQRDKMRAAMIMHDTFKQGDGIEGHTVQGHEIIAADAFNAFMGSPSTDIGTLISTHMGQWGERKPANLQEFFVHLADYLASRKDIEVIV